MRAIAHRWQRQPTATSGRSHRCRLVARSNRALQRVQQLDVALSATGWEAAKGTIAQRRNFNHDAECYGAKRLHQAVVTETLEGSRQVGALPKGFAVAGSEADLEGDLDGADGHRASGCSDVAGEVPGQEERMTTRAANSRCAR